METQFPELYHALVNYKSSVIQNLNKIDENLEEWIENSIESAGECLSEKHHKIALQIIDIIRVYVDMDFMSRTILGKVRTTTNQLSENLSPQKEHHPSNSFMNHYEGNGEESYDAPNFTTQTDNLLEKLLTQVVNPEESNDNDKPEIEIVTNCELEINDEISCSEVETDSETLIDEDVEVGTSELPVDSLKVEQCATAVEKLLQMKVPDRIEEMRKKHRNKILPKPMELIPKPFVNTPKPKKKPKEQRIHYEVEESIIDLHSVCHFCKVNNPYDLYIRTTTQDHFKDFESVINLDLNAEYFTILSNYKSKSEARQNLGDFCLACLTVPKPSWYRVQVQDWMLIENNENVLIELIDYGYTYLHSYRNLRYMSEIYASVPKFAIKCHLAHIYPLGGNEEHPWPAEHTEALKKLVLSANQEFRVIFAHAEKSGSYAIDVEPNTEGDLLSLGEFLVKTGVAQETTEVLILDEDLGEADNINEAIAGYDAQDEARICPFTNSSGGCYKGARCKLEHAQLAPDGVTTDKQLTAVQALENPVLPETGSIIHILITEYVDICRFYGIISDLQNTSGFSDTFQNLINVMNTPKMIGTYEVLKLFPATGEIILAKFDGSWCRGVCLGAVNDCPETFKIFAVDFGTMKTMKMTDIRQIPDDFLIVPFQVVEFSIDKLSQRANLNPIDVKKFFMESMKNKIFKAKVIYGNEPIKVQLWDPQGIDFAYVLDVYGFVENTKEDCAPPEECPLQLA